MENNKCREQKVKAPQRRRLSLEPLESREMLSINPVPLEVWGEVTNKYPGLGQN